MSVVGRNARTHRTHVWFEGLGEWSWPGSASAAVEALPPSWVPAFPPHLGGAAPAPGAPAARAPWEERQPIYRRLGTGALLSAVASICAALTLAGPTRVLDFAGLRGNHRSVQAHAAAVASPIPAAAGWGAALTASLPSLVAVSHDAAGSAIDGTSYSSPALHGHGSFLVYLPKGYGSSTRHYPVLYLLHGNGQRNTSFLEMGLQEALDRLIARHAIAPLIAVMIQGGGGANNWRDLGSRRYESYVLEVQELVDRALPTLPDRAGRAIAGYSMGGYGAANIELNHPERFAVVESWLGFFDGLGGDRSRLGTRAGRPLRGVHAFLYGAASDEIANPSENAPFAAALRAAGASAHSAVYPGGHTFELLHAHLPSMLAFAGRALGPGR